jgi:NitT/TauT family transport system substrate-binding protein
MIEKDRAAVRGFVKAVVRALIYTDTHRAEMLDFAKTEFPTASEDDLKASLDRSFADGIFSPDGYITKESWVTGEAIVREAGILNQPTDQGDHDLPPYREPARGPAFTRSPKD